MEYEYEKENKEAVMINQPKANKEMREVYRKAKAFDEIVNLLRTGYMQCADDNLEDIEIIINEYMWEIEENNLK